MNILDARTARAILRAALLSFFVLPVCAQSPAAIGDTVPDHEFRPLVGHDGRTRLADLYGQPVVVAGFKQHLVTGVHAAWVASHLLQMQAKNGLIVILEDQKAWRKEYDRARVHAFWTRIFGTPAWLTSNLGSDEDKDIHVERKQSKRNETSLVLIGVDGTLVLEGIAEDANAKQKKSDFRVAFKRAVATEMKRRKEGWGADATARKVRAAAFGKGNLVAAWKVLDAAAAKAKSDAFEPLRGELDRAFAARQKTVRFLLDQGRFVDAKRELTALGKSAGGVARYAKELQRLESELKSKDGRAGQKLDRVLAKILKPLTDRKFGKFGFDEIWAVRDFAQKHEGSRVAARAKRMDTLLVHIVAASKGINVNKMPERLAKVRKK